MIRDIEKKNVTLGLVDFFFDEAVMFICFYDDITL